ncbi:hypothetical protein F5878DRAFT_646315 [Lentinula raphanica]|uniref:Uncharacterized protein n=1 Tax=Lentinula raphanica TaxID=153919 RepID=A0AA38NYI5_9AGAR|nr:hypothetical protein F5880DRAFT_1704431 [Lentinula raphanica]KAJ3833000.1 hypothetical protein F5878DRAFT_646315 [Lentinula raphanica]
MSSAGTGQGSASYKTTVTSNARVTMTFASFGMYDTAQPTDPRSPEDLCMNKENIPLILDEANYPGSSDRTDFAEPLTNTIEASEQTKPKDSALQFEGRLAQKILARPPSLNGSPTVPSIAPKSINLTPIGQSDSDTEDTSNESVSDAGASVHTYAASDSSISVASSITTSTEDETGEPILKPLTVPPWHLRSRRANVASANIESHPPYTALDGPMRFPF